MSSHDHQLCLCGHPRRCDREGKRGQGHANGSGRCLACLVCEQDGAGPHVPERCGCTEFQAVELLTFEEAMAEGGVPCICGDDHFRSGHDPFELGWHCRVRYPDGTRCDCPGYEPDPRYLKEDDAYGA